MNGASSPIVAGGLVYVGSNNNKLYAFSATCRKACLPLWSFATNGSVDSLAVADGTVYAGSGGSILCSAQEGCTTIEDDRLYAFSAACHHDCQPLWSFATGGGPLLFAPAVSNGKVYVYSYDGNLYAFDTRCQQACRPLWRFPVGSIGSTRDSSLAIANGLLYVTSNSAFYVFDTTCRQTCQPLWKFPLTSGSLSAPIVANGLVYVSSSDSYLYVFKANCRKDCLPIQVFPVSKSDGGFPSPLTIANGVIYADFSNAHSNVTTLYALGLASH